MTVGAQLHLLNIFSFHPVLSVFTDCVLDQTPILFLAFAVTNLCALRLIASQTCHPELCHSLLFKTQVGLIPPFV